LSEAVNYYSETCGHLVSPAIVLTSTIVMEPVFMPDQPVHHILLLPRDNYWGWVGVCREYAIAFGVTLTPAPQNAALFHRPRQVISFVTMPGAYPGYGDIIAWLRREAPDVRLDPLNVANPDDLNLLLQQRIATGKQLGSSGKASVSNPVVSRAPEQPSQQIPTRPAEHHETTFTLLWPTDNPEMMQEFGENPDLYRRWGLPGHEGIDFKAPVNSNIYACADGYVYLAHDGSDNHSYGIHVRLRHADGFSTIYAHLNQALVHAGQNVRAGDPIGLADGTGNSTGGYVHLTLKKQGATAAGLTRYPNDMVDPAPYLVPDMRRTDLQAAADWPTPRCLIGLHGRADGPMQEADWQVVRAAKIEALKLTSDASSTDVDDAFALNPDMLIVVRLLEDFRNRSISPTAFAHRVQYDMERFYERGVRYFEVHNEPNLISEGYGTSWQYGEEFGRWFVEVVGLLKPKFPEAHFGWPGLSPGPTDGMRTDHIAFMEQAVPLLNSADWIGCHCYWTGEADMLTPKGGLGYQMIRDRWPAKLTMITEFSNTSPFVDPQVKADQYLRYYQHLRSIPGIGAAFAFVVSAAENYPTETWRSEDGRLNPIARTVGERNF
jgi:murein DD-endopeptidase MepM/ murein hydrolase activator NlpD